MNHYDASTRLDSELLRSFLFVVRHGSNTRAALALHRTQSAVSVQIKRFETALGVTLFTREPRGVSLTPAGEQLLGEASQILAMLDRVSRSFRSESVEGPVTVGVPDEYGSTLLAAMLADSLVATQVPKCRFAVDSVLAFRTQSRMTSSILPSM